MTRPHDLTGSRWEHFSRLLDLALDLPPDERLAWLDSLAGEPADIRAALGRVLEGRSRVETLQWMATLPRTPDGEVEGDDPRLRPGAMVGPYRLLRELGSGGMGAVWLAERADGALRRQVALKLPRAAWSAALAARMARERDILAALEHPGIARLYDAGTDSGRPYLALEYVEGRPIDAYCRERALSVAQRIELVLQVARAVAFAHSHLIVHRDLKPSNVLVTADGQARLLDFGIAKLLDDDGTRETRLTQLGGRALTLDYASPEQIRGEPIGTASDVYSLAVLAYELLAGVLPYRRKRGTAAELEESIVDREVPPASRAAADRSAARALRGDLDAILAMALRKDPGERYPAVAAFSEDLERHLRGDPVLAQPDSHGYRVRKFIARNRLGVGIAALTAVAILSAAGVALWQAEQARREAERARAVQEFVLALFRANTADQADPRRAQQTTARQLLDLGAAKFSTALLDQPGSRLILAETLGGLYAELQLWPEAARLSAERLALARRLYPSDHTAVVEAALAHAMALSRGGRADEAEVLLTEAEAALDRAGDSASPTRARLHSVAALHWTDVDLPRARRHGERALTVYANRHPEDPERLGAMQTLASVLARLGESQAATTQITQAVELARQRRLSEYRLAPLLTRAGEMHMLLDGDMAIALPLLQEGLAMAERVHGERSVATVLARASVARALARTSRPVEAARQMEQALRDAQASEDLSQRRSTIRIAIEVYELIGEYPRRRALIETTLAEMGATDGDSFERAILLSQNADLHTLEGRPAEALANAEASLAMVDRLGVPAGAAARFWARMARIDALIALGEADAALARLDGIGDGGPVPEGRRMYVGMARTRLLAARGRMDAARALAGQLEAEFDVRQGPHAGDAALAELHVLLASLARRQGRCDEARPAVARALEILERVHVPASPLRLEAEAEQAICRAHAGEAAAARSMLERLARTEAELRPAPSRLSTASRELRAALARSATAASR